MSSKLLPTGFIPLILEVPLDFTNYSDRNIQCAVLIGPGAVKDFGRGAGHIDAVISFGPVQVEFAAGQVCLYEAVAASDEYACDGGSACACAAGKSYAAASFPSAHCEFVRAAGFDEVDVDALGKKFVMFDQRADVLEGDRFEIVAEEDRVRIAHGDARHGEVLAFDGQGDVDDAVGIDGDGDVGGAEDWLAHVDADAADKIAIVCFEAEGEYAAAGLDAQRGGEGGLAGDGEFGFVADDAVIVDVLCKAADAVAAHLGFGAVGVEHAHADVGGVGWADENQAVCADAEVAAAHAHGKIGRVGDLLTKAIDVNIVVAQTMHFCEFHSVP